ncbi:hypothetical protein SLEP1_g47176 [Rubroshorea leprosula]|uniref:Uncharacterized protein n=1 Tax=Rubroshorea leprosula TaxID=152421 RepID=A0AAV5LPP9_9ROSI|nr:hypothetical protein SLEP1_g47176 [Rubroshorea leprosula]
MPLPPAQQHHLEHNSDKHHARFAAVCFLQTASQNLFVLRSSPIASSVVPVAPTPPDVFCTPCNRNPVGKPKATGHFTTVAVVTILFWKLFY